MKIPLDQLIQKLEVHPDIFVCSSSFEDRWMSVANQLDPQLLQDVVIANQHNPAPRAESSLNQLLLRFEKVNVHQLYMEGPLDTVDKFESDLLPILKRSEKYCLIDITTFTHEQLLILLRVIERHKLLEKAKFVYTGADEYSTNTKPGDKWLSKGVHDTRAILGYSGVMLPSKKLHLIVLVGFEYERAEQLIERYEPATISLGLGKKDQSFLEKHHHTNREFFERVCKFASELSSVRSQVYQFEFSCVDPLNVKEQVLKQAQRFPDHNVAVCPMNTKISTIGAGLAAIDHDAIQLCYAQPIEYNIDGYSTPGAEVSVFGFQNLSG